MYPDLPDVEFEPIKQATRSAKNATPSIDNDQNLAKNAKFVPNSSSQKSDTAFPCSYKGRKLFEDLKDATSSCKNSSKSKENKKTLEEIMYPDLLEDVHVDLLVDKNIEENFDQDIEYITIVEEFKIEAEDALISSEGANANVLVEKDFEENIQENCHPNEETSDEEIKVVGLSLAKLSKVKIEDFKVELLDHEQAESSLQSKENKTLDEKIDTFEERSEQSATKVNFATWVKEMNFDKFVNKILHVNATNDNEVNQILPRDSLTKEITNVISFSDNTDSDEVAVSIDTENYSEAHCTHCEVIYTRSLATLKTLHDANFSGAVFTRRNVKDDLTNHIKKKHGSDLNMNSAEKLSGFYSSKTKLDSKGKIVVDVICNHCKSKLNENDYKNHWSLCLRKKYLTGRATKPRMTYSELITEALQNSSSGMLTISEIYDSVSSRYPYYKIEDLI